MPTCNQALTMITQDTFTVSNIIIKKALSKMDGLKKKQVLFISEILLLFLSLRGRCNFLQLSREGDRSEKSFRYQFEKSFDWLRFNVELLEGHCSDEVVIGFDPSYIRKSGKHSPGLGHYYSGCQGRYIKGLEVGSFAAIDIKQHSAYHLEAIQSPAAKFDRIDEQRTLVDHYGSLVVDRAVKLQQVSSILVCDAYFSKKKFIDTVCDQAGFEMIGRLRDDANLRYLYKGKQQTGRGRPKIFDGKIDTKKIDKRRVKLILEDDTCKIYSGVVNSVGLRRDIRLAYVEHKLAKGKTVIKLYFSTNCEREATEVLRYYRARFQMEFLFRDGKQHVGLEHCQARSKNKLHFHFNACLTAVSTAKIATRHNTATTDKLSFSISDIKTEFQNRNLIKRFISKYGSNLNMQIIKQGLDQFLTFGKIAA